MAKDMSLIKRHTQGYDLMIEKDAGNPVRILMGGTREAQEDNWRRLRDTANQAIVNLDHPSLTDEVQDQSTTYIGKAGRG
jgi:hypothetical protein